VKKLIAYFSATGTTKKKAERLAKITGGDLYEIMPEKPYTSGDLNWQDKKSRTTLEYKDKDCRPELKEKHKDLSGYDVIYIGFPVWWYTYPKIINSFIEANDFKGKKTVLFCTSGGTGIEKIAEQMKKEYPDIDLIGSELVNGPILKDII
jgi:flavodoxin